jgi:hypothetical protein
MMKKLLFTCVMKLVAPRVDKLNLKPVTVKAGQPIVIDAQFVAEPAPTGQWSFEETPLEPNERVSMVLAPPSAKLTILGSKRSDTGKYAIKLTNDSGSDVGYCDVIVLSAPSKPKGPIEVKDVKK